MTEATSQYVALLEQRVALLRALGQRFVDCRKDFVAMDLDAVYAQIAAQEELCGKIQSIDSALMSLRNTGAGQLDTDSAGQFRAVLRDLSEAQAEVAKLNQVHAAYLRRCGRTITLFSNFFRSHSLTYAPPLRPGPTAAAMIGSR